MPARVVTTFALAALLAFACRGGSPFDTGDDGLPREARAKGPGGLEQRLGVVVDPEDFREPGFHTLIVTSDVVNTGSAPVTVTARICLFFPSDLEITAEADRLEPFVSCGAVQQTAQLDPGASVGPMDVRYRIRSGPGDYTIRGRHALSPEIRAQASFRIP